MYKPDNFDLHELIPPYTNQSNLWFLLDERILKAAQALRKRYGMITINDWFWGGKLTESGWRTIFTSTGSRFSQHKFGRALDLKFREWDTDEVRRDILADPNHPDFEFITGVELNTPWLHIDCRNWDKTKKGIFTFRGDQNVHN